jgi:hypothetical protein
VISEQWSVAIALKRSRHCKLHFPDFVRKNFGTLDLARIAKLERPGYLQLCLQFASRSARNPQKLPELGSIQPSLSFCMLLGIETADCLIWLVNPYSSSRGKV